MGGGFGASFQEVLIVVSRSSRARTFRPSFAHGHLLATNRVSAGRLQSKALTSAALGDVGGKKKKQLDGRFDC